MRQIPKYANMKLQLAADWPKLNLKNKTAF